MTRLARCVVLTPMFLGSTALFAGVMAHDGDMVNFGTDGTERFVGWDALKASVDKQFVTFTGTKIAVKQRDIKVGAGGNAAWATEVQDVSTRIGSEPVTVPGMRATTVLEKRGGRWLIVHFHSSIPVAGQAIKY